SRYKMSVEATALSRSKLEQKDRAELAAIVEAMGGKAGSRAKKADLVDQVLELAGAGNGSPSNGRGEPPSPPEPTVSEPSPPVASVAPPVLDDEPPAEWELTMAVDAPAEPTADDTNAPVTESAEHTDEQPRDRQQSGQHAQGQGQRE